MSQKPPIVFNPIGLAPEKNNISNQTQGQCEGVGLMIDTNDKGDGIFKTSHRL
jgi:hypothetical protein